MDTAAVFELRDGYFYPEVYEGRQKGIIKTLKLRKDARFVSNAHRDKKPVSILDIHDLGHTAFPEDIVSVYLFPLAAEDRCFRLLGIFNPLINRTTFDYISKFCRIVSYLCEIHGRKAKYEKREELMSISSLKILNLYSHYRSACILPTQADQHRVLMWHQAE